MDKNKQIAALFDLDGVILDTETQYTILWNKIGEKYHPEIPDFGYKIKGTTLKQICDLYFPEQIQVQNTIIKLLDDWESSMEYNYISGTVDFITNLRNHGVKTAIVTSSNIKKMEIVYRHHPEIKKLVDYILTAERFTRSKPYPDCYLLGAETCGVTPDQAIVFEDSFSGLKAGRDAKMTVVGLATTNSAEKIKGMADIVIPNFVDYTFKELMRQIESLL